MKNIIYFAIAVFFTVSVSSCGVGASVGKDTQKIAGYTLKSKKELVKHRILQKKTILATP